MPPRSVTTLIIAGFAPEAGPPWRESATAALVVGERHILLLPAANADTMASLGHLARAVASANERLSADESFSSVEAARHAAFPTLFRVFSEHVNDPTFTFDEIAALALAQLRVCSQELDRGSESSH